MSEIPFHATVQGRRYYEHSVPELIRQLKRVGDGLERLIELHETQPIAATSAETEGNQHGQVRNRPEETQP